MEELRLKKQVYFKKENHYSICLRGARRFKTYSDIYTSDINIYNPNNETPFLAKIINQSHYVFRDLSPLDYNNNYDEKARSYDGLYEAMKKCYSFFNEKEIVTVLVFKIL